MIVVDEHMRPADVTRQLSSCAKAISSAVLYMQYTIATIIQLRCST